MRFIIAALDIRPALLRNAARHTLICTKITSAPVSAHSSARRLLCTQIPHFIEDDMGKDGKSGKNFNLKVPKGTRDCTFLSPKISCMLSLPLSLSADNTRDRGRCGLPRPPLPNGHRHLQAPRSDDPRHARLRTQGHPEWKIWRRLKVDL